MRRLLILTLPAVLAGCATTGLENPVTIPEPTAPQPTSTGFLGQGDTSMPETVATGTFAEDGKTAITYDPRIVPAGATAQVALGRTADGITVRLAVTGMLPRRTYGAHLHTKPCTPDPAAAGPHYQHKAAQKPSASSMPATKAASKAPSKMAPMPVSPSMSMPASAPPADPAFANPQNEVWLDFTADRMGAATSTAVQRWAFSETTPPRSVIVHMTKTRTEAGLAGTAGERVACLTLPGSP